MKIGCDRKNLLRKKGYSIHGKPAVTHKLLVQGEHVSVIAAISTKGLLDVKICRGGVDSDTFYDFINDFYYLSFILLKIIIDNQ